MTEKEDNSNYTPFGQNVKQRDYTKVTTDGSITNIPEAIFTPPSMEELSAGLSEKLGDDNSGDKNPPSTPGSAGSSSPGGPNPGNQPPVAKEKFSANPALNDLDDSEKHRAAVTLVDAALDGYARLNKLGAGAIKFPMRKIKKMQRAKEIDLNIMLPIEPNPVSMGVFMETYNESVSDIFEVSDEFKKKVKPVAVRLAKKYNFGMSDEALLAYYVGLDITSKVAIGYQLHAQMREMLEDFKDMTAQNSSFSSRNTQTPTPAQEHTNPSPTPKAPDTTPVDSTPEEKPKRDFLEPEEINSQPNTQTFTEPLDVSNVGKNNAQSNTVVPDVIIPPEVKGQTGKMPTFGDKEILEGMEKIANKGKGKRK